MNIPKEEIGKLSPEKFAEGIALIEAGMGKAPCEPSRRGVWESAKYKAMRHIPDDAWGELCQAAFDQLKFWNQFDRAWADDHRRAQAAQSRAALPPAKPPNGQPCPDYVRAWLYQAITAPRPTTITEARRAMHDIRDRMSEGEEFPFAPNPLIVATQGGDDIDF